MSSLGWRTGLTTIRIVVVLVGMIDAPIGHEGVRQDIAIPIWKGWDRNE